MKKIKDLKIVSDKGIRYGMARYAIWACIVNLILETLERQSIPVLGGIIFVFTHPLLFFYNALLIFATLSVCFLFRRRIFLATIISGLWIAIGIANGVILTQRMTPFTMKDLSAMTDGATIMTNYISRTKLIVMVVSLVIMAAVLVWLFIKGPRVEKGKLKLKRNLLVVILIILTAFGSTVGLLKINVLSTFFGNLAYAYRDYGVAYCFVNTWLNQGIHKPSDYSEESVKKVIKKSGISKSGTVKITKTKSRDSEDGPNILFLQLESFVDPTLFTNVEYSQDPIPYYRSLMKKYSSGSLTVPACGAGTANTEFEVMTGISVKFFGPGEYPFKSVLKDKTAESLAWDLKDIGYGTHAIHNQIGRAHV